MQLFASQLFAVRGSIAAVRTLAGHEGPSGTIPPVEVANWTVPRLNNFRQNVQPEGEFSAPDLVVSVGPDCSAAAATKLEATIE